MADEVKSMKRARWRVVAVFFAGLLLAAIVLVMVSVWLDGGLRLPGFGGGWTNALLGWMLIGLGALVTIWSVYVQFTLGQGTPAPMLPTRKLVMEGPYAYCRNPMTLGALFLYLGIAVWMGSGMAILLTVIVFSLLLTYIYIHETHELSERFGEDYLEYKKRTPFLFPRCPSGSRK